MHVLGEVSEHAVKYNARDWIFFIVFALNIGASQ